MTTNATTRRARPAACQVCLVWPRRGGRSTCDECAAKQSAADRERYEAATAARICTRHGCTEPACAENRAYCAVHRAQRLEAARAAHGQL